MNCHVVRTDTADTGIRKIILYIAQDFGNDVVLQKLNEMGVRAMYEELRRITGVEIEFDSMDLNKEFGFGGDE